MISRFSRLKHLFVLISSLHDRHGHMIVLFLVKLDRLTRISGKLAIAIKHWHLPSEGELINGVWKLEHNRGHI
jgi:hypothetical protein